MTRPRLYVKSKRTTVITGHVSVESMGYMHTATDYAEGSVHVQFPEEDSYALDLLKRSGIAFEIADLSRGIGSKLLARIRGVRQTPTLLDPNGTPKSFVGIKEISNYVKRNDPRNP